MRGYDGQPEGDGRASRRGLEERRCGTRYGGAVGAGVGCSGSKRGFEQGEGKGGDGASPRWGRKGFSVCGVPLASGGERAQDGTKRAIIYIHIHARARAHTHVCVLYNGTRRAAAQASVMMGHGELALAIELAKQAHATWPSAIALLALGNILLRDGQSAAAANAFAVRCPSHPSP